MPGAGTLSIMVWRHRLKLQGSNQNLEISSRHKIPHSARLNTLTIKTLFIKARCTTELHYIHHLLWQISVNQSVGALLVYSLKLVDDHIRSKVSIPKILANSRFLWMSFQKKLLALFEQIMS
jgi:hypothetical protein